MRLNVDWRRSAVLNLAPAWRSATAPAHARSSLKDAIITDRAVIPPKLRRRSAPDHRQISLDRGAHDKSHEYRGSRIGRVRHGRDGDGRRDDALGGVRQLFLAGGALFRAGQHRRRWSARTSSPSISGCSPSATSTCAGSSSASGQTFHWHGRYHEDMNKRDTISSRSTCSPTFNPTLLPDQRRSDYLFPRAISRPSLQEHVLSQMNSPEGGRRRHDESSGSKTSAPH